MKNGFTLLEVLLSVAVMSTGVLTVVVLYSLGFRETKQSREDVASAVYADAVLAPLVSALTATNVKWSAFKDIGNYPGDNGWGEYYDRSYGRIQGNPESKANAVISSLKGKLSDASGVQWPTIGSSSISGGLKAGIIVMHEEGDSVVRIGFRACRNPSMLMSAPLYYTEARFQGDPNK